jgi:aminodeoxyfutalosine deaminase
VAPDPSLPPERLRALPKIELHVHLEGAITAERAVHLARRHGEDPEKVLELESGRYPSRYTGFDHFLRTFLAASAQVRTPDDLAELAAGFAIGQAAQGIVYSEVTFTAATHVEAGMEPPAMWAALRDGFAAAEGAEVGLIVDVVRDAGPAAADRTIRLVQDADAPVVGLGLSGMEGSVPESEFAALRAAADRLGLGLTVHAGETGDAGNVRAAVEDLGADRIGHGIATVHDPELGRQLATAGIPLEVCPSSNVALGLVPTLDEHPLADLHEAGLRIVIGSDDPPFFATTLSQELAHAQRLMHLDAEGMADLQLAAARAAFAPAATRTRLAGAIERWRDAGASVTAPSRHS